MTACLGIVFRQQSRASLDSRLPRPAFDVRTDVCYLQKQEAQLGTVMIPLWIKIAYTLYAAITVPVYAIRYPPANFLWFSDIALILTVPALWLESSLLASMLTLSVLLPEAFWNIGYFSRLLFGKRLSGLTDYMFDAGLPLYLRALSLFHVFLPVLLFWMVSRLGYASGALLCQTASAWIVLPATYWLTDPSLNVNWVFGPRDESKRRIPPLLHLAALMIGFPLVVYLPTHGMLIALFG